MSFAAKVEKLMFKIGLTDKTKGPVGKINARIDKLANNAQKGFRNIGYGAAGITGAVFSLNRAMAPAIEQQRALNEVSSLDVNPKALKTLNRMSLITQAQFGTASAEIVRSAYDIQSAISGLTGKELSKFTQNSAILAKGTKADASVITNYMGTMFGIFKKDAEQMGNNDWVDRLTGQTATAVQMFKTTGVQMNDAFKTLGAEGQSAKISMSEQMAVLGKLQATMSGSEAGTKYKAYLQNVGRAQKALGLEFVNSQGKMLTSVEIMEKITGKYGEIDTVAKSDALKQAFGSDEAVAFVKLMISDTEDLADSIQRIANVKGMEKAVKQAKAMTDPWQQLGGTAKSVHTIFSQALMPVLQPTIDKMTMAGEAVLKWTETYPYLTRAIAATGMLIVGLIGTIAMLTVAVGIYRFMAIGWAVVHSVLTAGIWVLTIAVKALAIAYRFARVSLLGFYLLSAVAGVSLTALKVGILAVSSGVWAFTAALLANPITWIVLGVVALGAAIVAAVVYWDDIKKAAGVAIDWMSQKLDKFKEFIGGLNPMEILGSQIDWLIEKINLIPGVDISTRFANTSSSSSNVSIGPQALKYPNGGIANQIRQMNTENNNNGQYFEHVTIKADRIDDAEGLQQKLLLQVG